MSDQITITKSQLDDQIARATAAQWLSTRRSAEAHAKNSNRDMIARGLRVLQKEGYLGTTQDETTIYYHMRSAPQAAVALAWVEFVQQDLVPMFGQVLSEERAQELEQVLVRRIRRLSKSCTGLVPRLLHYILPVTGEPMTRADLLGVEEVVASVEFVKSLEVEEEPAAVPMIRLAPRPAARHSGLRRHHPLLRATA